jgi:hypothetical protein
VEQWFDHQNAGGQMFKFSRQQIAQDFADRAAKAMMIILGDDQKFWVVTMAEGERLIRSGYETI